MSCVSVETGSSTHRHRIIGDLATELVQVRLDVLDLPLDIGETLLDLQGVAEILRLAEQRQQPLLLGARLVRRDCVSTKSLASILHGLVVAEQPATVLLAVVAQVARDLRVQGRLDGEGQRDTIGLSPRSS